MLPLQPLGRGHTPSRHQGGQPPHGKGSKGLGWGSRRGESREGGSRTPARGPELGGIGFRPPGKGKGSRSPGPRDASRGPGGKGKGAPRVGKGAEGEPRALGQPAPPIMLAALACTAARMHAKLPPRADPEHVGVGPCRQKRRLRPGAAEEPAAKKLGWVHNAPAWREGLKGVRVGEASHPGPRAGDESIPLLEGGVETPPHMRAVS